MKNEQQPKEVKIENTGIKAPTPKHFEPSPSKIVLFDPKTIEAEDADWIYKRFGLDERNL